MYTTPENPNELTIENSVVILIDHQPLVALNVRSTNPALVVANTASLARAARDLGVPTILTTVGAEGSVLVDPIFKEISDILPGQTVIAPPIVACLVTPGPASRRRGDGPQEAGRRGPCDRGMCRSVGARSAEGGLRCLFRQ
jgi:hypothetical protein